MNPFLFESLPPQEEWIAIYSLAQLLVFQKSLPTQEEWITFTASTGVNGFVKQKRADYLLMHKSNYPLAIVEAKDNKHIIGGGMQQALEEDTVLNTLNVLSVNDARMVGFSDAKIWINISHIDELKINRKPYKLNRAYH